MSSFKIIAQNNSVDAGIIAPALEIVREFCIERKLIIYGGLAIDYALRLKGESIYDDKEYPDYDMLSPNNVNDAYDLAQLLIQKGFSYVSAIRGIHVQTMRVRVDLITVADISYAPEEIFKKIPTLEYNKILIMHPNYQKQDIHLSLSFPFYGPPREAIFHRWEKDITRFNMLEKYYTLPDTSDLEGPKLNKFIWELPKGRSWALHGFTAYAAFYWMASKFVNVKDMADHKFSLKNGVIKYEAPVEMPILLVSIDPEDTIKTLNLNPADAMIFAPYMDLQPMSFFMVMDSGQEVQIYTMLHQQLSIGTIDDGVNIVCAQYLLLYFLHMYFCYGSKIYLFYYNNLRKLIFRMEQYFAKSDKDDKFINSVPLMLTTKSLTHKNYNAAYKIKLINDVNKSKAAIPDHWDLRKNLIELKELPSNYYGGQPDFIKKPYNYKNVLFHREGQKI